MATSKAVLRSVAGPFKPSLSRNHEEARRRVLNLYRSWYRQVPLVNDHWLLPYSNEEMRAKIKEKFRENKHITDLKVIDMLVIKGHLELHEIVENWQQAFHMVKHFKKEFSLPMSKKNNFMSKFLAGKTSD